MIPNHCYQPMIDFLARWANDEGFTYEDTPIVCFSVRDGGFVPTIRFRYYVGTLYEMLLVVYDPRTGEPDRIRFLGRDSLRPYLATLICRLMQEFPHVHIG